MALRYVCTRVSFWFGWTHSCRMRAGDGEEPALAAHVAMQSLLHHEPYFQVFFSNVELAFLAAFIGVVSNVYKLCSTLVMFRMGVGE